MEPVRRHELFDDVRLRLRGAIFDGTLAPGDRLVEEDLANRLGVSRAPVRDALKALEHDGLIGPSGRRGKIVLVLSAKDAWEVYSLRATLEAMGIRLAMQYAGDALLVELEDLVAEMRKPVAVRERARAAALDVRFHEAICRASGHQRLLQSWEAMSVQIRLLSRCVVNTQYRDTKPIASRHARLVAVMRAGDLDAADRAIREHIQSVAVRMTTVLSDIELGQTAHPHAESLAVLTDDDIGL